MKRQTFIGKVGGLLGYDYNDEGRRFGEIAVAIPGSETRVELQVDWEGYSQAVTAHIYGLDVVFKGSLGPEFGGVRFCDDVESFCLLEQPPTKPALRF